MRMQFNTTLNKRRTDLICPKGSLSINISCVLAQQSFYLKTKTFSDDCFKEHGKVLDFLRFEIFHNIKFNQDILTKVVTKMHQLSMNLLNVQF